MKPISWKCPFCNHNATIKHDNVHETKSNFLIDNFEGNKILYSRFIVCPNEECKKFTLQTVLFNAEYNYADRVYEAKDIFHNWHLIPQSNAKVLPDYIPNPIKEDYYEACSILSLSPKASATLARRCIQGMIRDFFKVSKNRLVDEISAIEDKIDPLTWKSIDSVRKIGNIGAHMEKDINLIIEVDKDEASILLKLIEQLIDDWYVTKHERELRHKKIIEISEDKENQKNK